MVHWFCGKQTTNGMSLTVSINDSCNDMELLLGWMKIYIKHSRCPRGVLLSSVNRTGSGNQLDQYFRNSSILVFLLVKVRMIIIVAALGISVG